MTDNPCDACREECLGGIIYGNCQHFRTWCKAQNRIDICFNSRLSERPGVHSYVMGK